MYFVKRNCYNLDKPGIIFMKEKKVTFTRTKDLICKIVPCILEKATLFLKKKKKKARKNEPSILDKIGLQSSNDKILYLPKKNGSWRDIRF